MQKQKGCEDSYSGTSGRQRKSPEDEKKPVVESELHAGGGTSISKGPEAATALHARGTEEAGTQGAGRVNSWRGGAGRAGQLTQCQGAAEGAWSFLGPMVLRAEGGLRGQHL